MLCEANLRSQSGGHPTKPTEKPQGNANAEPPADLLTFRTAGDSFLASAASAAGRSAEADSPGPPWAHPLCTMHCLLAVSC